MKLSSLQFEAAVAEAVEQIPQSFEKYLRDIVIDVEPIPNRETCRELDIRNPRTLLGVYRGTPLTDRSVSQPLRWPESIVLFKDNLERICRTRKQLVHQIQKTVLHEIGHHFGLDEDDLFDLGYG